MMAGLASTSPIPSAARDASTSAPSSAMAPALAAFGSEGRPLLKRVARHYPATVPMERAARGASMKVPTSGKTTEIDRGLGQRQP